jgi:hypothetical protein
VNLLVVAGSGISLQVCDECDAVWPQPTPLHDGGFRDLTAVLAEIGVAPLWTSLVDPGPKAWFAHLGYRLITREGPDEVVSVDLLREGAGGQPFEAYGRGSSIEEAFESARRRWQTEQIGSAADQSRNSQRQLP